MARLSNIKGKPIEEVRKGAYARCFGNAELSHLLSRVQGLIIKNGYELEKIVTERVKPLLIEDVDQFLSAQIMNLGVRVATKKAVKKCSTLQGDGIEPDFIVFDRKRQSQHSRTKLVMQNSTMGRNVGATYHVARNLYTSNWAT